MSAERRVSVEVTIKGGIPREDLVRAGEALGPLEVLRTTGGLGTGGVVARLELGYTPGEVMEDLRAIEVAVTLVREECSKRGWQVDGATAQVRGRS